MEAQRRITAHLTRRAKMVNMGVEQKIGEVEGQQQEHFTLTPVHQTKRPAEQQQQGRQYIEQTR